MLIYKLVLRPVLSYASPVGGQAAYFNIKMLESAQNKVIKVITDATWFMRNEDLRTVLKLKTLKDFFKKISTKFFNNIDSHTNRAVARIEKYSINSLFNRPLRIYKGNKYHQLKLRTKGMDEKF
ncbi:UNVERIFIED_CONTAM: X-element\ORF2 [Trichonephila clavipes]